MSLVDYASSSGEEEDEPKQGRSTQAITADPEAAAVTNGREEGEEEAKTMDSAPPPVPSVISRENQNRASVPCSSGAPQSLSSRLAIQLPDASLLFGSPSFSERSVVGTDHASRVAAANNENTSRKRDSNGFAPRVSSSKHPRGNSSHARNQPNIPGNLLPPQLRGRSNVVTEDISKLFVNRSGAP